MIDAGRHGGGLIGGELEGGVHGGLGPSLQRGVRMMISANHEGDESAEEEAGEDAADFKSVIDGEPDTFLQSSCEYLVAFELLGADTGAVQRVAAIEIASVSPT